MGWNTSVVLAEGLSMEQMAEALPDVFRLANDPNEGLPYWEAISSAIDGAVGELPGWGVLWSPDDRLVLNAEYLEAVSKKRALSCALSSVSDTYGFLYYVRGRLRRLLFSHQWEVEYEDGEPLPEEAGLDWSDPEEAVFAIARALTGLVVNDFDTWEGVVFRRVEL